MKTEELAFFITEVDKIREHKSTLEDLISDMAWGSIYIQSSYENRDKSEEQYNLLLQTVYKVAATSYCIAEKIYI